jgi:MoaA/NifB/PqqE/SkfB family radical SAM enzyme
MELSKKLFRMATKPLGRLIRGQTYHNFLWEISWDITYVCNMRCIYCPEPRAKSHHDVTCARDKLIRLRPKYIQVVGGEPLLVPHIQEHLKLIKERINPYIMLITNMMVDEKTVQSVVPYIDQILISIDGLGEINKRQRGIDGNVVLNKIIRFSDWVKTNDIRHLAIGTSTVVTQQSLSELPAFGRKMKELLPHVSLGLGITSPYWHPLSFGHDPELVSRMLTLIEKMKEEGINLHFSDERYAETPQSLKTEGVFPRIVDCKRQYFRANLFPDGTLISCKPWYYERCFVPKINECLDEHDYFNAALFLYRAVKQFILKKYDTTCYFPCKCTLWMEEILNTKDAAAIPGSINHLQGKFNEGEIEEANRFLNRCFGQKLGKKLCNALARKNGG